MKEENVKLEEIAHDRLDNAQTEEGVQSGESKKRFGSEEGHA